MNYKELNFANEVTEMIKNGNKFKGDENDIDIEFNPEMFDFIVREFKSKKNIMNLLEELRIISGIYLRFFYFEEFKKSGLCELLVQNLSSNNTDISVIMWEITTNLVSYSDNIKYANNLIDCGLFEQVKYMLNKLNPILECNYYVFYCLGNLANISVSIRDQIMMKINSDIILYYLQNIDTPISTIKIILKMICRLMFDEINEEQFNYIFSILIQTSEFLEFKSKQKLYLQCLFLLSNNKKFLNYINNRNEYQNIYSFINNPNKSIKMYIIGFTLNMINEYYLNLIKFIPDFILNLQSTSDKIVFGISNILAKMIQLTPISFSMEMIYNIFCFFYSNIERYNLKVKKSLYQCILSLINISDTEILNFLLENKVIHVLFDIILIEDEELTSSSIKQLHHMLNIYDKETILQQITEIDGIYILQSYLEECKIPANQELVKDILNQIM